MYLCVRCIDFASFCDDDIRFWKCSDIVVFIVFHLIIIGSAKFIYSNL